MEWLVYYWNFNNKKLTSYNILTDNLILEIEQKIENKDICNRQELKEFLDNKFKYDYWSRAEWEIIVGDLYDHACQKVDVYEQIRPNLDTITDYLILKMNIKFKKRFENTLKMINQVEDALDGRNTNWTFEFEFTQEDLKELIKLKEIIENEKE